ncbi:hypothetical protein [Actinokineospora sp.]|uniref:hypothetical protein n=1 Tax=Actinokineospora sp. TaxID=1872133 RepID=UPI003D6B4F5E
MSRSALPHVAIGIVWSIIAIAALVAGGVGVMLIAVALPVLAVAAFAAVVGHARFAFIPDRGNAVAVAAIAFALILIAGAVVPESDPTPLVAPPPKAQVAPPPTTTTGAEIAAVTAPPLTTTTTPTRTTATAAKATKPASSKPRPTTTSGAASAPASATPLSTKPGCDPSYPTMCLALTGPDLDCYQIPQRRFPVHAPDRHRFDPDNDGVGCE